MPRQEPKMKPPGDDDSVEVAAEQAPIELGEEDILSSEEADKIIPFPKKTEPVEDVDRQIAELKRKLSNDEPVPLNRPAPEAEQQLRSILEEYAKKRDEHALLVQGITAKAPERSPLSLSRFFVWARRTKQQEEDTAVRQRANDVFRKRFNEDSGEINKMIAELSEELRALEEHWKQVAATLPEDQRRQQNAAWQKVRWPEEGREQENTPELTEQEIKRQDTLLDKLEREYRPRYRNDDVARELQGLDSDRAWKLRDKMLRGFDGAVLVADGIGGLRSEDAWELRERLLEFKIPDLNRVLISGLTGMDTDRAWDLRDRIIKAGVNESAVMSSLVGLDSNRAWDMRERLMTQPFVSYTDILDSVVGLDSDRAWDMREKALKEGSKGESQDGRTPMKDIVVRKLAGLDSDRAWDMRSKLLKNGASDYAVAAGLAGLDSDRAWNLRDQFVNNNVDTGNILSGLKGVDSPRAAVMRKRLSESEK